MRPTKTLALGMALAVAVAGCSDPDAESPSTSESPSTVVNDANVTTTAPRDSAIVAAGDAAAGPSFVVVDTGQTTCYDAAGAAVSCPGEGEAFFGQDGNYAGTEAAYADNGDGTVTDLNTGLMWQQDPGEKMTYDEALAALETFELAGYDDWRLPTIKELYSLIDFSGTDPSNCRTLEDCDAVPFIDTDHFVFSYGDTAAGERVIDSQYLSSTMYVSTTMNGDETVFGVNFADGRIKGYGLSDPRGEEKEFFVMFVRGNAAYGDNDLADIGDGTVTDAATGLTWQQADDGVPREWEESLVYCEALELGGYDDWRLPDVKELQSIVDYTRSPATSGSAAIDPIFETSTIVDEGGDPNWPFFWSSTTHASQVSGGAAAYVAFGEALGWMEDPQGEVTLLDVHGAGSQRSDPKTGDAADYPYGNGPQGDVVRIENATRCVRGGVVETTSGGPVPEASTAVGSEPPSGGPLAQAAEILGIAEDVLAAALGDPRDGPPDLEAAAEQLGVTMQELRNALGIPGAGDVLPAGPPGG
jgi:hypothetical protein